MKKRVLAGALALAMLLSLAACGGNAGSSSNGSSKAPETAAPAVTTAADAGETVAATESVPAETEDLSSPEGTRVFTDDAGREVEIPSEISRIVPTGQLAQIVLFGIAPDLMVGLSSKWSGDAEQYISGDYFNLPVLGQLYGSADLNLEELALADPQLIIDVGEAKKSIVEDMDDMQTQTSIPSVHIDASLSTMADAYRKLGSLLGREERGEELAAYCENVYNRTLSIMEEVGENKVKGLFVLGEEGLNVIAAGSFHAEVFDLLTDNLAVVDNPSSKGSGNEVTMEQIALWNPDFVLFAPESIYASVADMETWKDVKAIADENYIEVPFGPHNWMGMPPSVQRYLGLIWLTAALYPDYCDYDVKEEVKEYYRLFYSCDLTDEQYEALTANAFLK